MQLGLMALSVAFLTLGATQSEITGAQSAKPRVMVIFDNSRSMEARPDNDFDSQFFEDDLASDSLFGGVCEPSQPPANCRNKFCIGKCVMHNAFDPYDSLLELGFASYYHYLRKTSSTLWTTGPRTLCNYDVIANPGELIGQFWSLESNLDSTDKCTLSQIDSPAHRYSDLSAWGESLSCRSTNGIPEPAKNCRPMPSSNWLFQRAFEHVRYSPYLPSPAPNAASAAAPLSPIHPYQNELGPTGYTSSNITNFTFSGFGPNNGRTYFLFETRKDTLDVPAPEGETCQLGEERHFWSSPTANAQWSQCSEDNPCWAKLIGSRSDFEYKEFTSDQGPSWNGYTFDRVEGPFRTITQSGSDDSLSCPGGQRAEDSGQLTQVITTEKYMTSTSPYPVVVDGLTYEYESQYTPTASQVVPGNSSSACPSTYNNLPLKTGSVLPGEPSVVRCNYVGATSYTLVAQYTENITSTPTYHCEYETYRYIYKRAFPICVWQRTQYVWRPQTWQYAWETSGGEIVANMSVMALNNQNACTSPNTYDGALANACPEFSTSVHPICGVLGRYCRLRWRETGNSLYPKGRITNFVGSAPPSSGAVYCRAADHQNMPTAAPPPSATKPHWCATSLGQTSQTFEDIHVLSDPYSPTVNPNNQSLPIGSEYVLGGKVNAVSYSLDGVTWSSQPPLSQKLAGWSRTPPASSTPGRPAMSFLPVGPNNLEAFRRIMEKYDAQDNPLGLRMPTRLQQHRVDGQWVNVTGHNTPLYGSLTNAKDYFVNEVFSDDPALSCRTYAVILVTDGDENQRGPQPQHPGQSSFNSFSKSDLVAAVTGLRNASYDGQGPLGGIKTYVLGFGGTAADDTLNALAVAGGTALNGKAYNATSPFQLQIQLQEVLNGLTNNRYTRSKPVITLSGDRLYIGAFRIESAREWKGELAAYNLTTLGVDPQPVWEFQDQLNAQSAGLRKVFTTLPQQGSFNLVGMTAGQANAVYEAMGLSPTVGAQALQFMLNPSRNAPFLGEPTTLKTSRLSSIFHSTPVLVGAPPFSSQWAGPNQDDMAGYEGFRSAQSRRPERLFVGSNTGMVHAICDKTAGINSPTCGAANEFAGNEMYAFVPPGVFPQLNQARVGHKFTVDGSFGAGDVCLESRCDTAEKWMTLLVGSMHKGGNRLFAADVTSDAQHRLLWEFSDVRLGETWSPPTLARARIDSATGLTNRWIGIVGGGYLSPSSTSADVSNSIWVIDLKEGKVVEDKASTADRFARFRVDFNPTACATDSTKCVLPRNSVPGRIAVSRDNASAFARYAFFGDTQGRMWSMSLQNPQVSTWRPQVMFDPSLVDCSIDLFGNKTPIYEADADSTVASRAVDFLPFDDLSDPRPLFQRLVLSQNADGRSLIFGGTGDEIDPGHVGKGTSDKSYDYLYGVRYNGGGSVCSGHPLWVKRLRRGEKVLSEGTVGQSVVFLPTYMPPTADNTEDFCTSRGNARIYAFYQATGNPARVFAPDQNQTTQAHSHVVDLPGEGIISDLVFVADPSEPSKGRLVYATDSGEPRVRNLVGLSAKPRVLGWRRIR